MKLASQAKPQAFFHSKTKLISSILEPFQLVREVPMFYKPNFKYLYHQCSATGQKLHCFDGKIDISTNFASQFHVKSSYTFTQNAEILVLR